jgi:lipopolysaccharide biosynthesis glycosyltransferase
MNKNLIYTCLSFKKDYFCLLELFLKSLSNQAAINNNFDLLVILDEDFLKDFSLLQTNINTKVVTVPKPTSADMAMGYKFIIYDWLKEQSYDKVLFTDVDTVFVKHPDNIFKIVNDYQLFVKQEQGDINDIFHGQGLFSKEQLLKLKDKNIDLPLNSGTFAFNTKSTFLDKFINFNKHITAEMKVNTRHPGCDQTFFNLYFLEKDINCLLNEFVTICKRELSTPNTTIYHSVGGEYYHKYDNLKDHLI